MIDIFRLIFIVFFPTLIGFVFISFLVDKNNKFTEVFALSYLVGSGILSLELLLLGCLSIPFSIFNILLVSAIISAIPVFLAIRNRIFKFNFFSWGNTKKFHWTELGLLFLIIVRVGFVFYENLLKPVIGVDAFANWSLRAKVFFFNHGLLLDPKNNFFLGGGATFYPIHLPLLETWGFLVLGRWDDVLVKIIFSFFFLSLLVIFYHNVRRTTSRFVALLSTYLLTTLPLLLHHATVEYADLPLGIYFLTAALFLFSYFETEDHRYFFLSAIFAGIGAWTKNEGFPIVLLNLVVLVIYYFQTKRKLGYSLKYFASYFFLAFLFKAPWLLVNYIYKIPPNIYQKVHWEQVFTNLYRIPVIAQYFYQKMFFYGNWNIAWFVLVVVIICSYKHLQKIRTFYSLIYIVLFMGMIAFMYYLTDNYRWLLDGTTLNRNFLLVMPLVIYFIAVNLQALLFPDQALNSNRAKNEC